MFGEGECAPQRVPPGPRGRPPGQMAGTAARVVELNKLVEACEEATRGEAAVDRAHAVELLGRLRGDPPSREVLQQAQKLFQLGKRVRQLRKCADARVAKAAAETIRTWREAHDREEEAGARPKLTAPAGAGGAGGPPAPAEARTAAAAAGSAAHIPRVEDGYRNKVRALFAEGLRKAHRAHPDKDHGAIAANIESELHALYQEVGGNASKEYKAKARSLAFNLRDEKNPDLRASVLSGAIGAGALVQMDSKDLASKAMKSLNSKILEEATKNAMGGGSTQESTDQFKCGKCGQRKCTYYQMQTRSADEPMTTFVTCTVCNNRWKFC